MFDHRRISPKFWMGTTGKALKARGPEALIVSLYLMTSAHSSMLGLYHLPIGYIAIDTGLGMEGASKGLQGAIEAGFCRFDDASEMVWVIEMAAYQVADQLDPKDLRCKGVQREYDALPENPFLAAFFQRYHAAFHMTRCRGGSVVAPSPSVAPCKPGTGTGTGTGAGAGSEVSPAGPPPSPIAAAADAPDKPPAATSPAPNTPERTKRGKRLDPEWVLPKAWGDWALDAYPHWTGEIVRLIATKFRNHWVAKGGKDATKLDWYATWQNWCHSSITQNAHRGPMRAAGRAPIDAAAQDAEVLRLLRITPDGGLAPKELTHG